jgi:hypothetical protein
MKKKEYSTPAMEIIEAYIDRLLMGSVNSEVGIGYGGVDEDGTLDPAAPQGQFDMDDWEE